MIELQYITVKRPLLSILLLGVMIFKGPSSALAEGWTPPSNPNPSVILNEAESDARRGDYQTALEKLLWYHKNALSIEPGQFGVRLSFALGYWKKLGTSYPPALEALRNIRKEAGEAVLAANVSASPTMGGAAGNSLGSDPLSRFLEYYSISKELGEEGAAPELFKRLDKEKPEIAKAVYQAAKPSLLAAKEYKLCLRYTEPEKNLDEVIARYRAASSMPVDEKIKEMMAAATNHWLTQDIGSLIALLAVNGDKAKAAQLAEKAKREIQNPELHRVIDAAMKGEFPSSEPPQQKGVGAP